MLNEKKLELDFYLASNDLCCWGETKVKAPWLMTLRGRTKYVQVVGRSRELCELCSALRREVGGGGQLFEDEIIVWLHPFTPMAHRGLAKQPNGLCYLISVSASPRKGRFFLRVWLWRTLCPAVGFITSHPVEQPSLPRIHFRRVSRCRQKWGRAMSLTLTHLAAHWLLSGPCEYVAFGRNGILYSCLWCNVF